MSSLRDFVLSVFSDSMLPVFRQTFEDVVYESLNERKVPSRTDFLELRDLVNKLRGQASSAKNGNKKLEQRADVLEAQLEALQGVCREQAATIAELRASVEALQAAQKKPARKPARKRSPAKKGARRSAKKASTKKA